GSSRALPDPGSNLDWTAPNTRNPGLRVHASWILAPDGKSRPVPVHLHGRLAGSATILCLERHHTEIPKHHALAARRCVSVTPVYRPLPTIAVDRESQAAASPCTECVCAIRACSSSVHV